MSTHELLGTDFTTWDMGPFHAALPGPFRLRLTLDGEIIAAAAAETGFAHRGLEKTLELHPWHSSLVYADRLDPEAAIFAEFAFCLAGEELGQLEVPERGQAIRVLLSELARVSSHLFFLVKIARSVGAQALIHYALRDRERILDLFELLTGARHSLNFLRFGGVASDVTDGFIERVLETCGVLRERLKEYNDLFTFNQTFLKRAAGIGVLPAEVARKFGVTGPNARAAGISTDVRRDRPYSGYDRLDFEVPEGHGEFGRLGDVHDRLLLRLREVAQCLSMLRDVCESIPSGDFCALRVEREFTIPRGESYARVESARGRLGCYLVSDGERFPLRAQFRGPSVATLGCLPRFLRGVRLEDLPMVLASFDLSISEVDK